MSLMLEFYGFREHPFGVSPNPRFLYPSAQHREALASLIFGIENQVGFAALIAEPGAGKTTLMFELLLRYRERASTAFVFNTLCSGQEMLRHIVLELQIPGAEPEQESIQLFRQFTAYVADRRHTKPVLIIIDEAQNLENSALETLRLLSNFEAADHKLLHIILAGQPQLAEKLRSPSLEQLLQRITTISRLQRFSAAQIEECIAYRVRVAGYSGPPLFSKPAMAKIIESSRGIPREINRICINALQLGFALRQREIGGIVIEEVLSDLNLSSEPRSETLAPVNVPEPLPMGVEPIPSHAVPETQSPGPSFVRLAPPPSSAPSLAAAKRATDSSDLEQRKVSAGTAGAKIVSLSVVFAAALVLFALTGSGHQPQLVAASGPFGAGQPTGESQTQQSVSTKQDGGDVDAATASDVTTAAVSRREVERSEKSGATARAAASNQPSPPIISAILQPKVPVRMVQARQPLDPSATSAVVPPEGPSSAFGDGPGTRGPEARIVPDPEAMASADPSHVILSAALQPLPRPDAVNTRSVSTEDSTVAASVDPRPSQGAADGTRSRGIRTGETSQAVLARFIRPVYPPTAKESRLEGEVSLKVDIAADGYVSRVSVLSGNALLAQAAINAVEQWRYRPALLHGSSVEAEEKIIVAFHLDRD